tara:strand:- start:108 stop:920 length:813 start_codon:yes stop_codon:yes gene_type:complete
MPFIGNTPDVNFTSFAKQDLTGVTGSPVKRGFTLTHAVANANEIEVFVNNVRQEPTEAYTVNGTGLTMTGDVETTDDFYIIYLGKALQTTVPPDGSVSTAKIASSAVDLTSKVTGVLPVANGGSGLSSQPMFKAIGADSTAIVNNTWVKAQFNSEVFDVGGYYDPSSNYRYTPQIAGKYLIYSRAFITYSSDAINGVRIAIYKNGSQDATFNRYSSGSTTLYGSVQVQALIDFNGSSDYVEIFVRGFTSADISYNINNSHGEFSGYRIGA